jgi:hypothetical protein
VNAGNAKDIDQLLKDHIVNTTSESATNDNGHGISNNNDLGDMHGSRFHSSNVSLVDVEDKFGQPLLHVAINKGNIDIVKLLLRHKANMDTFSPALVKAVHCKHPKILKELLDAKANPSIADPMGMTALHHVVRLEMLSRRATVGQEMFGYLIAAKADVNALSLFATTPLLEAVNAENVVATELLMNEHVDMLSCSMKIDSQKQLMEQHSLGLASKSAGQTTASISSSIGGKQRTGNTGMAPALPTFVEEEGIDGMTALHVAIAKKNPKLLQMLIQKGQRLVGMDLFHKAINASGISVHDMLEKKMIQDEETVKVINMYK